jgi:hypothetical protein
LSSNCIGESTRYFDHGPGVDSPGKQRCFISRLERPAGPLFARIESRDDGVLLGPPDCLAVPAASGSSASGRHPGDPTPGGRNELGHAVFAVIAGFAWLVAVEGVGYSHGMILGAV